ncbi:MAG: 1-deoxy-D-xylulose-5-phosphate reductoisomerase [Acidimicrobiaceae bacterium]|nr:1-deoxy-D-xylulose-5-phosphate reductoisomerase [Acidimicrobiaceae bacterium]
MKTVAILGSTGSVGLQTLDVLKNYSDSYKIVALAARGSVDVLADQACRFRPEVVALADPQAARSLQEKLPKGIKLLAGDSSLVDVARSADIVINAVVGFAGLPITLAVLQAGKRLGLANKESLIAAGPVVRRAWSTPGAEIIPIDSEHSAVQQCLLSGRSHDQVSSIVLTASGGPFLGWSSERLQNVTVENALAHPTWQMGPKITVDSSTLMNKGLEVIEAHELFDVDYDRIEVVVHRQSVVHSMVTFCDGAVIAQLSMPDMRLCISYALACPDRLDTPFGAIDWTQPRHLDFEPPDRTVFPCLDLAYEAGRAGETAPAWLNAANEVAVQAFLDGRIAWVEIAPILAQTLAQWPGDKAVDLECVLAADVQARQAAIRMVEQR